MGQAIRIVRIQVDGVELTTKPETINFNLGGDQFEDIETNRPGESYQVKKVAGSVEGEATLESDTDIDSLRGQNKTVTLVADNGRKWKMGNARWMKEGVPVKASDGTFEIGYSGTPFKDLG